jgi:anti-anti-sigma regulatory factor
MGARLIIDVKEVDGSTTFVQLSGVMDEDNELGQLAAKVPAEASVVIDSSGVERINSCGVRDWVTCLAELNQKACKLFFLNCSPAIVTQVNLVNNFLGNGQVLNFYAPYFCASCEIDKLLLIDIDQALKQEPFQAPICRCDQCDHTMDFDDIESSYFAFLKTTRAPEVSAKLAEAINGLSSSTPMMRISTAMRAPKTSTPSGLDMTQQTPQPRNLRGLLTDISSDVRSSSPQGVGKILYVIVGLLAAAIALLTYVVLRSN